MRGQEIRRLKDERSCHLTQLEQLEQTREQLRKARAKVEDLQAQLENKTKMERYITKVLRGETSAVLKNIFSSRQLSLEKSNLESSYEEETKQKSRMSMQVEELQWRIKNKLELPPTQVFEQQQQQQQQRLSSSSSNSSNGFLASSSPLSATSAAATPETAVASTASTTRERPESLFNNNNNNNRNNLWSQDGVFR